MRQAEEEKEEKAARKPGNCGNVFLTGKNKDWDLRDKSFRKLALITWLD